MNETCPHCGILFQREHGYFLNALFIGYVLDVFVFAAAFSLLYLIGVESFLAFMLAIVVLLLAIPFVFRYARVLWMHIDEIVDPRQDED